MSSHDLVCIHEVRLVVNGDKAGKYEDCDGNQFWLPWSQLSEDSVDTLGDTGTVRIPRWLAEQKDLEYDEDE